MGAENTYRLDRIDLGPPAAERDKALDSYFVESDTFRRVQEGAKTIILGNRGAGKSAILQILAARAKDSGHHVIELAPEDYSYDLLRSSMLAENEGSWAKMGAYAAAWKYLLYILTMKAVSSKTVTSRKGPAGRDIYKYIRDNHRDSDMSKLSTLISYLKRLEGVKIGSYEVGLRTRELERLYKLEEISELLPKLAKVLRNQRVVILVDELDKGWDASEDAQSFVAGLFQACITVNRLSPSLRVYMSLRQELYDNIPAIYDDAQKYRDIVETISWSSGGLLSLMAKRIRYSLPGLHGATDEEAWNAVFAETLDYRRNRSFNYVIDRTLHRPREIIELCSSCIEHAVGHEIMPPLNYATITDAEKFYSENRTKDIASEYRFQYPGLLSVFEFFRGKYYRFTREELEYSCLDIIGSETTVDSAAQQWLANLEVESLIDILWKVGFLHARVVGGVRGHRRSGSSYAGPHQIPNLTLANIQTFQIHPMFRSYLGLREPKSSSRSD